MDTRTKVSVVLLATMVAAGYVWLGIVKGIFDDGGDKTVRIIWFVLGATLSISTLVLVLVTTGKLCPFLLFMLGFFLVGNCYLPEKVIVTHWLQEPEIQKMSDLGMPHVLSMSFGRYGLLLTDGAVMAIALVFGGTHAAAFGRRAGVSRIALLPVAMIISKVVLLVVIFSILGMSWSNFLAGLSDSHGQLNPEAMLNLWYCILIIIMVITVLVLALLYYFKNSNDARTAKFAKALIQSIAISFPVYLFVVSRIQSGQPGSGYSVKSEMAGYATTMIVLGTIGILSMAVSSLIRQFRGVAESSA
ncbi:MAG: hypothetical protein ABIH04_09460 [Planctomycetota bacterium]